MRSSKVIAVVAALVLGAVAQPHQHQHRHHHVKKHDHSPVELGKRDVTWVTDVQAVYIDENGEAIEASKAVPGIANGIYIVVGETTPTFTPPVPPSSTAAASSTEAAQFFEHKSSSSTAPPAASSAPASASTPAQPASSATPSGTGLNSNFPSGQIQCSAGVPTSYGPIALSQTGIGGWASLQVPNNGFTPGVLIDSIMAPTSGGCATNTFCSYACPPGYQKSQWPATSQGASGQSVGGLWCNAQGFLELTRPEVPQLCIPGAGGVTVQNNLSGSAYFCRTDYPGSESMVIPLNTQPGGTYPLTNPSSPNYYNWKGMPTTAQYYVNNMNVGLADSCTWQSSNPALSANSGNWAPLNVGVGQDATGITYISLFANLPTSTANLNFNVQITGDISGSCSYTVGQGFSGSGSGNGCTVGMQNGGSASIVLSN